MNFFEANNISKTYENHTALDDVSLKLKEGTIYGLLGPNGAGKTTMIRIINRIIGQDSGELIWQGQKMKESHTNDIGYLPEERGLYKKMKVGEHGLYLAQLKGVKYNEAQKKLKYWFEKFDIINWWDKRIEELSKGMQQKIQFILTLIHEPKLYILDEPFSGFDPINTELLKEEILILKQKGASIILSTHNMSSVEELCDEMMLLNNSKSILEGNVNHIKNKFKKNIIEVHYSENTKKFIDIIPSDYIIINSNNLQTINTIQIQIPEETSANDLLNIILPHCRVHSLFEIMPSLNEIFIEVIKTSNSN